MWTADSTLFYILEICRDDSPVITECEVNTMKLSDTERQSGAIAVQRAFANTRKVLPSMKGPRTLIFFMWKYCFAHVIESSYAFSTC